VAAGCILSTDRIDYPGRLDNSRLTGAESRAIGGLRTLSDGAWREPGDVAHVRRRTAQWGL